MAENVMFVDAQGRRHFTEAGSPAHRKHLAQHRPDVHAAVDPAPPPIDVGGTDVERPEAAAPEPSRPRGRRRSGG